jgi:hypothetical protein
MAMNENKAMNAVSIAMYVTGEPPDISPLLRSTSATPTEIMPKTASSTSFLALETERKARKLESIPETVRAVLGEYFKTRESR